MTALRLPDLVNKPMNNAELADLRGLAHTTRPLTVNQRALVVRAASRLTMLELANQSAGNKARSMKGWE